MIAVWLNLVLRVVLLVMAIAGDRWHQGDTPYYLGSAHQVCSGAWGGNEFRPPMFSWLLCLSGAPEIWLVIQSLLAWGAGVLLFRRFGAWVALIWLYDPTLLVYSGGIVMSDALFAMIMLGLAWACLRVSERRSDDVPLGLQITLGAMLAMTALTRPIGVPLLGTTLAFVALRRPSLASLKQAAVAGLVALALISPRLYWNAVQSGEITLGTQGRIWFQTVAAAVEYSRDGLDFAAAEKLWFLENRHLTPGAPLHAVLAHPGTFAWMSGKGVARVAIGHVNLEWIKLLTGKSMVGPGLFKPMDQSPGAGVISGMLKLPWYAAVLATAIYCLAAYAWLARHVIWPGLRSAEWRPLTLWALASALLLATMPMVFGDARFRLPIIAMLLVLAGGMRAAPGPRSRAPG